MGIRFINKRKATSGLKLFDTIENMQADPNPSEGDLAVVYREELTAVTADSEFSSCTFPNEVVLDEAFTDNIYGRFRAVDSSSSYFDGMVDMSSSNFIFDGYSESGEIQVEYESEDGITYTRTDGGEESVEFGITIKWESGGDPFNNIIGNFMQIGGNVFDGLFEYGKYYLDGLYTNMIDVSNKSVINKPFKMPNIDTYIRLNTLLGNDNATQYSELAIDVLSYHTDASNLFNVIDSCIIYQTYGGYLPRLSMYNNNLYVSAMTYTTGNYPSYIMREEYDFTLANPLVSSTYRCIHEDVSPDWSNNTLFGTADNKRIRGIALTGLCAIVVTYLDNVSYVIYNSIPKTSNIEYGDETVTLSNGYVKVPDYKYLYANTSLDTISDYVYEKIFYGKNGVEIGSLQNNSNLSKDELRLRVNVWNSLNNLSLDDSITSLGSFFENNKNLISIPNIDTSNVTDMSGMFRNCSALISIPNIDTSNVTDMGAMFNNCNSLKELPKLDTSNVTNMTNMLGFSSTITIVPQLDTSKVTVMSGMFRNCSSLVTIPILNTKKVTNMSDMFVNCESLDYESLNNILVMCTNATKITSNKTLKYIGLTSEQANICKGLSNYSAFTVAGWATGY